MERKKKKKWKIKSEKINKDRPLSNGGDWFGGLNHGDD